MQKITLSDIVRMQDHQSHVPCNINLGDLVEVLCSNSGIKIMGIVTQIYPEKMCLLINHSKQQWWSRYVNCKVIS